MKAILDQPPLAYPHLGPQVRHQSHTSPFPAGITTWHIPSLLTSKLYLQILFTSNLYLQTQAAAARSLGESREKILSQSSGGRRTCILLVTSSFPSLKGNLWSNIVFIIFILLLIPKGTQVISSSLPDSQLEVAPEYKPSHQWLLLSRTVSWTTSNSLWCMQE